MEKFRTGGGRGAPVKQASRSLRQWIGQARVGEREIVGRVEMIGLLAPGPHRLAKANVERHEPAANMREDAIEHATTRLVAVEAKRKEAVDHPPALRAAFDDREIVGSIDWIGRPGIVLVETAQEGAEVASGGKSKAPTVGSLAR